MIFCLIAMSILATDSIVALDSLDLELQTLEFLPRFVENNAFGPGEHLRFSVEYGIIRAGTATLSVSGPVEFEGRLTYRLTATARSNPAFSTFYRVNSTNEALLDIKQFHTLRFYKNLEEGDFRHREYVLYDQNAGVVFYPDEPDSLLRTMEIPAHALDVLSALYFVRTLPLEVGNTYLFYCHADNDNYALEVVVLARENIRVPAGEFSSILVQPRLQTRGVFDHRGELFIWLTDDERRMPVLLRSSLVIGEIICALEEHTTGVPLTVDNPGFPVFVPQVK